jgi:hypothetical protein
MTPRLVAGLLLASLLPAASLSQTAQLGRGLGGRMPPPAQERAEERPSHKAVNNGVADYLRPEEALAARLRGSQAMKKKRDLFDDKATREQFQALAKKLLSDEKFLESLRDKFSREDIEKILGGLGGRDGLAADSELMKLLREGLAGKALSKDHEDLFRREIGKLRSRGVPEEPSPNPGPGDGAQTPPKPNQPPPPQGAAPPKPLPKPESAWKLDKRTQDWLTRNLDRMASDVDKWLESPGSKAWREYVKDFASRYEKAGLNSPALAERARGLSRYMPRVSNWLPRPRVSIMPRLPRIAAPRIGLPSAPRVSGAGAVAGGKVLLWLAVCGVVAFLLWRAGGLYERARQARAAAWRLGPWPVRPQDVSTRGELVRAFEYLALLCLGRSARTRHHLDLARQIGRQPSLDADRRREAAAELAHLYEQARYRPEGEALGDEDLRRARRDLCYLAGVAAA